jgi:hypothetical protein
MKKTIVTLSSLCLFACGMDAADQTGTHQDALYGRDGAAQRLNVQTDRLNAQLGVDQARLGVEQLDVRTELLAARESIAWARTHDLPALQRADLCTTEWIRPTAQKTIQSIPRLGVFGVAPVGNEVQSSYFRTNSVNEEFRKGVAEFYVPGEITGAVLQFREHRGWTSYPLPSDRHQIEVYPANLELDPEDFGERGVVVGTFDSDPNLEPAFANSYDLTKAVQQVGAGKLGLRFSIEGGVGSGTSFMDLTLEVTRCRELSRPGF